MKTGKLATMATIAATALFVGAIFGRPGSGRAEGNTPVNAALPTLSGAAQEGQALATSAGSWSGAPTSYAYAWSRCDASGSSCATISGATAATYTATPTDVGGTLRVTVTATNAGGSGSATSAPSAVVSSAAAPTPTTAPAISGSAQVGSTLTASQGTWNGSPTSTGFTWLRCDANGDSCAKIDGATSNKYTVMQADAGGTLRIVVVATNAAGSTHFTSPQTAAVPASNGCPAGTGVIQVADLRLPARLSIESASITPRLVTLGTHTIQLHFKVTACGGRPVEGASVFATPIPFNQFAGPEETTGADGTVTVTEQRRRGFPARRRHQHLLAVFARATRSGDAVLGGISTRRTVAFRVNLP